MRMNLFRTPQHRRYEYIPRYYDPEKEDRDARFRRLEQLSDNSVEGAKIRISSQLRRNGGMNKMAFEMERRKAVRRSNIRLFLILVILVMGTLVLLQVYLPQLLEML